MTNASSKAATKLLDSIMAGDMPSALSTLHAECVVHEPASLWYGGDWKGPDGFTQILQIMTDKLDLAVQSYEVFPSDEVTIMKAEISFTSKLTGRSLVMPVTEVYRALDGQLIDMDIFYKDTAALRALGDGTD